MFLAIAILSTILIVRILIVFFLYLDFKVFLLLFSKALCERILIRIVKYVTKSFDKYLKKVKLDKLKQ